MTENEKDRLAALYERNHWRFNADGVDGKPYAWRIVIEVHGEREASKFRREALKLAEVELKRPVLAYEIGVYDKNKALDVFARFR